MGYEVGRSEAVASPAVTNPGWDAYAHGESGHAGMIFDQGPNSIYWDSLVAAEMIDAPERWNPYAILAPRANLPPLLMEGSAQRAHPNILALAEFTPIGPGEMWLRDFRFTPPGDQMDVVTWTTGLGQVANEIALIYGSAQNVGQGAAQNAGINNLPALLPSDLLPRAFAYDNEANPSGPSFWENF